MAEPTVAETEENDVANAVAEEDFDAGMRQNAMEYNAADKDQDNKLDFEEFYKLLLKLNPSVTEEEARGIFAVCDTGGDGKVTRDAPAAVSLPASPTAAPRSHATLQSQIAPAR